MRPWWTKRDGKNERGLEKPRIQERKIGPIQGTREIRAGGRSAPKMMCEKGDLDCATKVLNLGP